MLKKITVLTLFPKTIESYFDSSIIKLAIKSNKLDLKIVDFREFSDDKHKKVDDYQFGGGPGMVLSLQPIVSAIDHYKTGNDHIVLLSPQGTIYNQQKAISFAKSNKNLIIICGHYEGFDDRIINFVDEVISIGDYILTGGEIAAMTICDSVIRLLDKSISKDSLQCESFDNNLLDYDVYTRPTDFQGFKVHEVLIGGNHKLINQFRLENQIKKTKKLRPDLYKKYSKK